MPSAKFDVDISSFKSGIDAAKSEVKTLNQQMKMLDATIKAEGKSEQTLAQQTQTLNSRLAAQKSIANQAEAALKTMTDNGVDAASEAYQKMARELLAAQTGMKETEAALKELGSGAENAAEGADKLETGLKGITKKISLDQVISGISKISDGLKNAGKHAVNLGESLFNAVMDKARLADDNATMAMMYGIDLDTYLKMQGLVASGMDTSVEAILKAQTKLNKGIGDSKAQETLKQLKITMSTLEDTGDGILEFVRKDPEKLFWEIGNAIMAMGDAYDKEAAAQSVFGRSWKELVPLFKEYKSLEEYQKALNGVQVISEESNESLAGMADSFDKLHQKMNTLTTEILAQFAPGLTSLADSLSGLLSEVLDYLDKPEGKEALASMSESIKSLFGSIKDISAEDVVSTFRGTLDKIVGGFEWLANNGDTVIRVVKGLGIAWAGLKVSSGVLTILKVIGGLKDLLNFGGGAAVTEATLGTSLGTWLNAGMQKVAGVLGSPELMNNSLPVGDWFTHNTALGRQITNTINSWLGLDKPFADEDVFGGLKQNAETFAEDWANNAIVKAVGGAVDEVKKFFSGNEPLFTPKDMEEANWLPSYMKDIKPIEIPTEPKAPEGASEDLASQIGTVTVPIQGIFQGVLGGHGGGGGQAFMMANQRSNHIHANGLPFVPYDGYLALLHQGERIMTATENRHYTYNSHNYFGNVNLNNGQDIENLCDRIDVHNRRQQAGYGG